MCWLAFMEEQEERRRETLTFCSQTLTCMSKFTARGVLLSLPGLFMTGHGCSQNLSH